MAPYSGAGKEPPLISTVAPTVDRTPVDRRSAKELLDEYLQDPRAADARYKGAYIRVSGFGTVEQAGGDYHFRFRTVPLAPLTPGQLARLPAREQRWHRAGAYPANVTAELSAAGEAEAAKLKGGEEVALVGRVKGSRKADVLLDVLIELEDADLVVVGRPKK